jgi:hypothetical protein
MHPTLNDQPSPKSPNQKKEVPKRPLSLAAIIRCTLKR